MIEITLQNIPNQEFLIELDGKRYDIRIRTFKKMTFMDISIDDVVIKKGVRVLPNTQIIPYAYTTKGGNLLFVCPDNDYPYYTKFSVTQKLYYLTDTEIEGLKANAE